MLTKDAIAITVTGCPGGLRSPHNDKAAIRQGSDGRLILIAIGLGIGLSFAKNWHCGIRGRSDVDGDHLRLAGTAVSVADLHPELATGHRIVRSVGVGQVFNHGLHRLAAGIGV